MYIRLRNEAIDNDKKAQRDAFELLSKHIELMNDKDERKPKRALKTMTDAQEKRIKALVSEMSITIGTIFQNFGKATFGGIGGLQTRYENLATAMREILNGPYDTDDKDFATKLTASLVPKLKQLESLLRNEGDSFTLSEKEIVRIIINNMESKTVQGTDGPVNTQPAFEPLGSFTDFLIAQPAAPKRGKTIRTIEETDEDYGVLVNLLDYIITNGSGKIITEAKSEMRKLQKDTVEGEISATIFKNIKTKADELEKRLEEVQQAGKEAAPQPRRGRPTTRQSRQAVIDDYLGAETEGEAA